MGKVLLNLFNFLFILILFLSFSYAYKYNSTYDNLTIDANGWCSNIGINFKIYNKTEYDLYKNTEDHSFENISGSEVKIHDGPLQSLPVIFDQKANQTGEFFFTFNTPNNYLIEIHPSGKFNDYHELFNVYACKHSNPSLISNYSVKSKLKNNIFSYGDVRIILENTDMTSTDNITIKNISGIIANGLGYLNNSLRTVQIIGNDKNFSIMSLEINLSNIKIGSEIKAYKYVSTSNNWKELPLILNKSQIIIANISYGIYSITEEKKLNLTSKITKNANIAKNVSVLKQNKSEKQQSVPVQKVKEGGFTVFNVFMISLFLIGFVLVFMYLSKNNKLKSHEEVEKKETKSTEKIEILSTYNQVYNNTKKYVQTYKKDYGKDQIYRALKHANVPNDIIDKVFLEVY